MNPLLAQIFEKLQGQAQPVLDAPAPPTPTPMTEESLRRQAIREALASAGKTLATTPGNFLTGLGVAAGAGGETFAKGTGDIPKKMMEQSEKDQQKRMALLNQLFGGARAISAEGRADESLGLAKTRESRAAGMDAWRRSRAGELDEESKRRFELEFGLKKDTGEAQLERAKAMVERARAEEMRKAERDRTNDERWKKEFGLKKDTGEAVKERATAAAERMRSEMLRNLFNDKFRRATGTEKAVSDRMKALGLNDPWLDPEERKKGEALVEEMRKRLTGGTPRKGPPSVGTIIVHPTTGAKMRWDGKGWAPLE